MSAPVVGPGADSGTDATRGPRAIRLLASALVVGIAGDVLLRGGPFRLGFSGFILLAAALLAAQLDRGERERRLLLVGLVAAALGLSFRDLDFVYTIDFLSVLCMGALVVWHGTGKRIRELSPIEAVRAALLGPLALAFGAPGAIQNALARSGGAPEGGGRSRALLIGAVLAVPPLFIVMGLLAESDAVFDSFVQQVIDLLSVAALQHAVIIVFVWWIAAGWMRISSGERTVIRVPDAPAPAVPFLTVSVGLYGLVALLALFLATQARVLFGGAEYLRAAAGLTLADYARNGFFEMVAASGIVLGTLVIAEWLLGRADAPGQRQLRLVGTVLVAEVVALLGSALARMHLYVREFGLTVDRGFALSVMVLVAAVLVVVAVTTLRGRGERFGPLTFAVVIAWVTTFNLLNIEGIVVRANVTRAVNGAPFDARYHGTLSADALPVIRAQAPRLPAAACTALRAALAESWASRLAHTKDADARSRSLSLVFAMRWVDAGAPLACPRSTALPLRAAAG